MAEINLLKSLPKSRRNISNRKKSKTAKHIQIAKEFGKMFFDGPREFGYGGYSYDGRWKEDKQHGLGTMVYIDGCTYTGSWENGKRHGQGKLMIPDGRVLFDGKWKEERW